jgi:hypothetical protein
MVGHDGVDTKEVGGGATHFEAVFCRPSSSSAEANGDVAMGFPRYRPLRK